MSNRSRRSALTILRAIIYTRVSADDGKRGRSCDEQGDACTADCEYEGWPIGEILKDNDRGASRHSRREREQFKRLPRVLRRGDVLVVWEPSRITRTMKEFSEFCDLLADRGVLLYYDGHLYDMEDDEDRHAVWQDILDGAKAVAKTRKRVLRAMEANLKDNKPHGRQPPGYEIVYERGRSVGRRPVPAQQRVLRTAADRVLAQGSALSMAALARELHDEWRTAGGTGRFVGADLVRILTNPTTFGFRVSGTTIAGRGTWEPVLDPELYPSLKSILKDPKRLTHRGVEPRYLVSSIARCGVCLEMGMRGIIDHQGPRKGMSRDVYNCRAAHHVSRSMARVDLYVEEFIVRLLGKPDAKSLLLARDEDGQVSVDDELALIDQLRREIETYVRDAAKTRMSAAAVALYVEARETEIVEASERVNARKARVDPLLLDLAGLGVRERWKALPLMQKRAVLRDHLSIVINKVENHGRYSELGVEIFPRGVLKTSELVLPQGE
ncbi:recombinase family protein [Nocardia wallacei]|uniref:recombinase family protein n=1 Tax=Nocardia wallacei TaxID=480035 RepID=UPI0024564836|nr:recombinase family protein [Nocardia wallacei]